MKQVFLIISIVFSATVYGSPEYRIPPSINEGERGEYIPRSSYEILGVSMDAATFEAIKSKLGNAKTYKGNHTADHICYVNGSSMVEFTISSLGFGYEVRKVVQPASRCGETSESIESGIGIKLGMSRSDVLLILGAPSKTQENNFSYTYWVQEIPDKKTQKNLRAAHEIPSSEALWLDVYSRLNISFVNGQVGQFSVHTTETY